MDDRRVLIFPPGRRDGEATRELLERAGLGCCVRYSAREICEEVQIGAGVIVLTDVALMAENFALVTEQLKRQPPWSDLPVVLLSHIGAQSDLAARIVASFTNLTVLDRPTSARMLRSAVQAALRARLRQYQTRAQLAALQAAEEGLRARENSLRLADRRKDEFLAMLGHELRNPLAPIRYANELLVRLLPDDPRLHGAASIVQRQIAHLSRLVDDLLDVSRITLGRIELQREPVDLVTIVDQARESVEPLMREKGHELVVEVSGAPLVVNGDHARLVQCLTNILTNSAKYTDGGGKVRVRVRRHDSSAVIEIADNGVGIPHDLLPHIFELFVQSTRSLDRAQGGLGIGLSVVRRLIEMHGGQVAAYSDGPGQGARFEVRLPLSVVPRIETESPSAEPAVARRILVVDDNTDAANSLATMLEFAGHTAQPVYSASAALLQVESFAPEVVVLDIGLPDMDGYEVARRLRAAGSHARIVALTGYGQVEDRKRSKAAGFDAHLVKPVDLQTLERCLDDAAEG